MREQESRGKASGHERQSWPCSGRAGPLWSAATTSGWTSSGGSTKRGRERTCAGRTGDGSGCCGDGARLRQHSYRSQASVACETRELERRALAPHSPVPDQPCLSLSHSYTHTLTLHTAHSTLATSPQLSLSHPALTVRSDRPRSLLPCDRDLQRRSTCSAARTSEQRSRPACSR